MVAGGSEEARRALLLGVAASLALGIRGVLLFSLGMSALETTRRVLAAASGVPLEKLRTAWGLTVAEWTRLFTATDGTRRLKLILDDSPRLVLARVDRRVRALATCQPVGTVVIDDLARVRAANRATRSSVLDGLEALARDLHVAVLVGAERLPSRRLLGTTSRGRRLGVTVRLEEVRAVRLALRMFGMRPSPGRPGDPQQGRARPVSR